MTGTNAVPDPAATGTILLMAAERGGCRRLAAALRRRGLGVLEPASPGEALALARGARPSVAALDLRVTGVTYVIGRLHADDRCGRPAIGLLVPCGVTPVPSIVPADGVEVIEWDPDDPGTTADRLTSLAERQRELRASSPLTGLPGNAAIRAELEDRFAKGHPTGLLYVDLDAFKPYNDRYGFLRGDEVLRLLASLLVAESRRHPDAFVGHVGGDDFVVLVSPEQAEPTARRIASSFDLIAPHLYDPADAARGRLVGRDRLGRRCRWPLLSVSVGVARSDRRHVTNALELTDIATEMKRVAKRTRGSAVAVDQRTSQDPPMRWRLRALGTLARPSLRRAASVAAAVLLAAVLFVPAGGAIAMAKPGELLWPAARMLQDVRFALADPETAVSLRFELAGTLLTDAVTALDVGDEERAAAALVEYQRRYGEAVTLLDTIDRPVRDDRLDEISETGDRQAAVLSGLVESRCEQPAGGASACGELRAALASVARTPAPSTGSSGDVAPRAPGTASGASEPTSDTAVPTEPTGGPDPVPAPDAAAGSPSVPVDPPGGSSEAPPGAVPEGPPGAAGDTGPEGPGGTGTGTPGAGGGDPAGGNGGTPGDAGATPGDGDGSQAPSSPATPATAPPTGEPGETTDPAPETTRSTRPPTGTQGPPTGTPGPPAGTPGPPAGTREPPSSGAPGSRPPASGAPGSDPGGGARPPGQGGDRVKDGWDETAPARTPEPPGPPGERGSPPDRPGANRPTGGPPDRPVGPLAATPTAPSEEVDDRPGTDEEP